MEQNQRCKDAYSRLRPHCTGTIDADSLESLDIGLNEEPYYTLSWLIADILDDDVDVPKDALLDAYGLLEDEDREEYAPQLDAWLKGREWPCDTAWN